MTGLTISSNLSGGYAAGVGAPNPLNIAPGVTVAGTNFGVTISSATTIINNGLVASTNTAGTGYAFTNGTLFATTAGLYLNGGSVTNTASGTIRSALEGVALGGGASLVNAGSVLASAAVSSFAVMLNAGGGVYNAPAGSIDGGVYGVLSTGLPASVINRGTIAGTQSAGVDLFAGGTVVNAAGATIYSGNDGIFLATIPSTVINQGFIDGVANFGAGLIDGGYLANRAGGTIVSGKAGVRALGNAPVTILNAAGALIYGTAYGVEAGSGGVATIVNTGSISGGVSALGLFGSGTVSNTAPGIVRGGATGIYATGVLPATVTNTGAVYGTQYAGILLKAGGAVTNSGGALAQGGDFGVQIVNAAGTVVNGGTISARYVTNASGGLIATTGARLLAGGLVNNLVGGTIAGPWMGVQILNGTASVANAGIVQASDQFSRGIYIGVSPATTAAAAGVLNSANVVNDGSGTIQAGGFGVFVASAPGTVTNSGSILATAQFPGSFPFYSAGVRLGSGGVLTNNAGGYIHSKWMGLQSYGSTTVFNQGTIKANDSIGDGAGVWIKGAASVTNAASGWIGGGGFGVVVYNTTTLVNQGTIFGATYAFDAKNAAGFAQRIIDTPGAVFTGLVHGGNAIGSTVVSTLELASGPAAGTIANLATFVDFGQIQIDSGATWSLGGTIAAGQTAFFAGTGSKLILGTPGGEAGVIASFVAGNTIELAGLSDASSLSWNGNTLTVHETGGATVPLIFDAPNTAIAFAVNGTATDLTIPCFLPGTQILTDRGEIAVEALKVGDTIVTLSGRHRRLCWIGQGKSLATRGQRSAVTPVIVRKGALAANVPHRDLRITKGHSLFVDGVLVPAEYLVNHRSILWDDRAQEVTVFHLELDEHDILLADGAPAESYRDDGNRWLFRNANDGWDQPAKPPCAPVLTGGTEVDAIWMRLLERAGPRPGIPLTEDPDLHLVADGKRIDATEVAGTVHIFRLAATPSRVRIASRDCVPAELGLARDARALGVGLRQIAIRQGSRFKLFRARDAALSDGFQAFEADRNIRWTDGNASLPDGAFARFSGPVELILDVAATAHYIDDTNADCLAA